ncbi:MAG: hypothetical protein QM533_11870 [Cytophagales bacterium]|nr:hypothetical protein [Cytophagales bacterium]
MLCAKKYDYPSLKKSKSLVELVDEYVLLYRDQYLTTKNCYVQMRLEEAIDFAGKLLVRNKLDDAWKKHAHFHRPWFYKKYKSAFAEAVQKLLSVKVEIQEARLQIDPFDKVFALTRRILMGIKGLKYVACYDITCLLGYHFNFQPSYVYLHAGALKGANFLLQTRYASGVRLSINEFPYAITSVLMPFEIEDFLCIYKKEISRFDTTEWIRIDRDRRGT